MADSNKDSRVIQIKPRQEVEQYDCIEHSAAAIMHLVLNGISSIGATTREFFCGFRGVMKEILPKLSDNEQKEVMEAFKEYQMMLMTTQEFLTRTTLRTKHAIVQEDLIRAIDAETLEKLCNTAVNLWFRFWTLSSLIEKKFKDQRLIEMWRNVSLGLAGLAASALLIGTGVAMAHGLSVAVKSLLFISGATTVLGLSAAAIAQATLKLTSLEQVLENLKELIILLSKLSQRYSDIKGLQGELQMDDKNELLDKLKEAQREVNEGFDILARF